jgi:acetate kinase
LFRIKKYLGSYLAVLNGADIIIFTGGIGENSHQVRKAVLSNLDFLGILLDCKANEAATNKEITVISSEHSKIKIFVIPTDEELQMAKCGSKL